jgi:hypothetical protein
MLMGPGKRRNPFVLRAIRILVSQQFRHEDMQCPIPKLPGDLETP